MLADDAYTSYADDDDELEDWPGDPRTPSRRFHRRAHTTDDDAGSGDDEGDEGEEDEPYAICDPEALLVEARGLLRVGRHVGGSGGDGDVGKALAGASLHPRRALSSSSRSTVSGSSLPET